MEKRTRRYVIGDLVGTLTYEPHGRVSHNYGRVGHASPEP